MRIEKIQLKIKNLHLIENLELGFTYIEAVLYITIVSIMLTTLIPFAWSIVEGGSRSALQQEVSSNARYISERIKYEMRNSLGINSVTLIPNPQISLCETSGSCATNPTIITCYPGSQSIRIQNKGAAEVKLHSDDVIITSCTFANNSSVDNKTKNISFVLTIQQANTSARSEFKYTMTVQGSAEVRSN